MIFLGTDLLNSSSVSAFDAGAGSSFAPTRLQVSESFALPTRRQALFSEEIDMGLNSEIDFGEESILVEVS